MESAQFDRELVARYNVNGPRYTSFPTANHFNPHIKRGTCVDALVELGTGATAPLSLYVHIPFCDTICYYCACNKVVTKNRKRCEAYLDDLLREMALYSALLSPNHRVDQIHFGGGTPTYLSDQQFQTLFEALRERFTLSDSDDRDFSIEVDPRTVDSARIAFLADLGFNRMSLGVQDLDPDVQLAVNRFHTQAEIAAVVDDARAAGFRSINVDLIYGLPRQTPERFEASIRSVIELKPDRIALYSYAHLPHRFKTQKQIRPDELPQAEHKLTMLNNAVAQLSAAGYEYVGMDHFALPGDPLLKARESHTLQRNFQGYTSHGHCDLIGLGVSAISSVGTAYWQNSKDLSQYKLDLSHGRLPVERGITMTRDDYITRDTIQRLMCDQSIDFERFQQRFGVTFQDYYEPELEKLNDLRRDGLVEISATQLRVTPMGQYLLRNIAMVFDTYLSPQAGGFSKAI